MEDNPAIIFGYRIMYAIPSEMVRSVALIVKINPEFAWSAIVSDDFKSGHVHLKTKKVIDFSSSKSM